MDMFCGYLEIENINRNIDIKEFVCKIFCEYEDFSGNLIWIYLCFFIKNCIFCLCFKILWDVEYDEVINLVEKIIM